MPAVGSGSPAAGVARHPHLLSAATKTARRATSSGMPRADTRRGVSAGALANAVAKGPLVHRVGCSLPEQERTPPMPLGQTDRPSRRKPHFRKLSQERRRRKRRLTR